MDRDAILLTALELKWCEEHHRKYGPLAIKPLKGFYQQDAAAKLDEHHRIRHESPLHPDRGRFGMGDTW